MLSLFPHDTPERLKFVPLPQDQRIEVGANLTVPCQARGADPPSVTWHRIGGGQVRLKWTTCCSPLFKTTCKTAHETLNGDIASVIISFIHMTFDCINEMVLWYCSWVKWVGMEWRVWKVGLRWLEQSWGMLGSTSVWPPHTKAPLTLPSLSQSLVSLRAFNLSYSAPSQYCTCFLNFGSHVLYPNILQYILHKSFFIFSSKFSCQLLI